MRISVITPTYNRPELLRETIESFLRQDYKDKEMIIVDDKSNDDGYRKIYDDYDNYGKNNIIFQWNECNYGCPMSLNFGIKKSSGEMICIIADDDLLEGIDSLSSRIAGFEPETDVVYTGAYNVDISNKVLSTDKVSPVDKDRIWQQDYINIQSMMWRRRIHDKIGYFSEDLLNNEDWEWKIKCLMECNVKALDLLSVRSRYHGGNKSLVDRKTTNECAEKLIKRMKEKYHV